jgi:hypothetical protein
MSRFSVLFALLVGACASPRASPPPLSPTEAATTLRMVRTQAAEDYRQCLLVTRAAERHRCQWPYDMLLGHLSRADVGIAYWHEDGAEGRFRCLMRHAQGPLAGLSGGNSEADRAASRLGEDAPDRCSP